MGNVYIKALFVWLFSWLWEALHMVHSHTLTLVHDRMLLGRSKPNNLTIKKTFSFFSYSSSRFCTPPFDHQKCLKSQNVRKQTPPNMPTDSKTFEIFKLKNQTKKWPLKIQKPKISLKSQTVRKQTLLQYAHWFQNIFQNFQNSKINLKNDPWNPKT